MSDVRLAQFQEAAVRHIVARLIDATGSRRMLLADEVGLGKTLVAQGIIQALLKRRRRPLTVIYLCSNSEIAEQNRTKLDPDSRKPVGRITELALERESPGDELRLYSFTPGTSLKDGTGLEWERRLLMFLLYRIYGVPVWTKAWREYFRCGAGPEQWQHKTSRGRLFEAFERRTSGSLQGALAVAWRDITFEGGPAIAALKAHVESFDSDEREERSRRHRLVATLRGVMQRVVLGHLKPDLVILDEVQRFRDVIDVTGEASHIATHLFANRVPVLILSATPYRMLTLGHEVEEGAASHHEDFVRTLAFLFDRDKATPERIRRDLAQFGEHLKRPQVAEQLDPDLLALKRRIEADLRKVICRTERNWYVLDRHKGVDDGGGASVVLPQREELREFFLLHRTLAQVESEGRLTEFWKSAPGLLTFLDGQYGAFRHLRDQKLRVPRALVTPPEGISGLVARNHRIAQVVELSLGAEPSKPPKLWTAPTYTYYADQYYGAVRPRKVLVFSGWRFVPKTVAIVTSRVASDRLGDGEEEYSQALRFSEKWSFHVFDVCFPSPRLAAVGHEAFVAARREGFTNAEDVVAHAEHVLRRECRLAGIDVVHSGGDRPWQVVMRLEQRKGDDKAILEALETAVEYQEPGAAEHLSRHVEQVREWLRPSRAALRVSEDRLKRLALVAVFSPAVSLLRACGSVYGDAALEVLPQMTTLCAGAMRLYFNRPLVQSVIRKHKFRLNWRQLPADDRGFVERTLVYCGDAHLQAVLDEYLYLLRHASQADTVQKALAQLEAVWTLSHGSPRANRARGYGDTVHVDENSEVHAAHFALAFGEEVSKDAGPDRDEDDGQQKLRKSVVREAFNSPFWPFVLSTTSVGQEGLDFHLYCRDVLHWNLPSNPVDLEQREGRINRRDCLAVRESIAADWPLETGERYAHRHAEHRNPWVTRFDHVAEGDSVQKYKHGLFPHWVYECRNPEDTVRIRRHVPMFSTSRDAAKYERLKRGLALYRLVFGQVNQEDLLRDLEQQLAGLGPEARGDRLRRLASYMLNLSPIGHEAALRHAEEEADGLLKAGDEHAALGALLRDVQGLQERWAGSLGSAKAEIDGLVGMVEEARAGSRVGQKALKMAVAALAYLRNPYDHIFDLHVDGGFVDDIEVIRDAWRKCLRPAG